VEDWDSYHDDDEMDVASPPLKRRRKMTELMMFHADRVSESVTRFTSAINQQTLGPLSTIQNGGNTLATLWNLTLVLEQETIVPKARVLIQYVLLGAEFERRLKYLHAQLLQLLMWHTAEGNPRGAALRFRREMYNATQPNVEDIIADNKRTQSPRYRICPMEDSGGVPLV
jgi:hypothetical protein